MSQTTYERIEQYFRPHNRRLNELLDRKFSWSAYT